MNHLLVGHSILVRGSLAIAVGDSMRLVGGLVVVEGVVEGEDRRSLVGALVVGVLGGEDHRSLVVGIADVRFVASDR